MRVRTVHRILGIVLLLPFLGWAATGFVFFLKPGYAAAYELLSPKTYPLERPLSIRPRPEWLEVRLLKTVLGDHLLVRTAKGWLHLNPADGRPRGGPAEGEIERLLADAFTANPRRYGEVASLSGRTARTSTGIEVTVDWDRLSLQQRGPDTDRIDRLYKIHYLQWTGIQSLDRVLGLVGLTLVVLLTVLGARLAFRKG